MNFGIDIDSKSTEECLSIMSGVRAYLTQLDKVDNAMSDLFKYSYYMDSSTDCDLVQFHTVIQVEIRNQKKILKQCEQRILEADKIDKTVDENILCELELLLGKLIVNHQIDSLTRKEYITEESEKIYHKQKQRYLDMIRQIKPNYGYDETRLSKLAQLK